MNFTWLASARTKATWASAWVGFSVSAASRMACDSPGEIAPACRPAEARPPGRVARVSRDRLAGPSLARAAAVLVACVVGSTMGAPSAQPLPEQPQLDNYPEAWNAVPFPRYFLNTIFVASGDQSGC